MRSIILTIACFLTSVCLGFAQNQDSLAFIKADWEIVDLGKGAVSKYAQFPMFDSMQSVCVIKYPAHRFKTEILHRPKETAGKVSEIGSEIGATFAVNASYFNMEELIPSVYFNKDGERLGYTYPAELYRVDGVMGFKDRKGRKSFISHASDTSRYDVQSRKCYSALASGPLLIHDGDIVVPEIMGDKADGVNVKVGIHYSSSQFYDKRHPRAVFGTDDDGYIYLLAIDGRFKGQADGASIYETAYICLLLGMKDAINLDGGGSTTLWTAKTGVINHPSDNKKFDHEGERTVPNLIVAY